MGGVTLFPNKPTTFTPVTFKTVLNTRVQRSRCLSGSLDSLVCNYLGILAKKHNSEIGPRSP